IKQSILDLKKILDSDDVSLISAYKSRNDEFRCLPPKVNVSLPRFSPNQIDTEQLHQTFGSLSAISITKEAHSNTLETPEAASCPQAKSLLDAAEVITSIQTKFTILQNVSCLSDNEIWTHEFGGWKLHNICGTTTGDLLVTMDSDFREHARVVRYSGSTEKQIIQFDSNGKSLYSHGYTKDIVENRNLDICVADYEAKAVVVVNQAGIFRF
ncbi:uncharacterized protein LOC134266141, partial [Saccostrea cucullata]|uniref:uncharacterized protein LOC134266141 n=1 Tax=Saccostrea cuccullata TaxID=36930 RepID=UPI002ED4C25E